tara:strand:- start:20217 stop:21818 length:1602 start_codon:yes stop_codon:yes gene_type:complete
MSDKYLNSDKHNKEHSHWDRRGFLKVLGIAGAGSISLGNSHLSVINSNFVANALGNSISDRVLVMIRLKGGNDGLNTIIPVYDYDNYVSKRPSIHIPKNNLVKLNDDFSIPSYMNSLNPFWKDGNMKVVHGVGYENQNLSHFTSSDIWATGTKDKSQMSTGWLGRYYDEKYFDYATNPPDKPVAIQIGSNSNMIFKGDQRSYAFAVANEKRLEQVAERGEFFSTENLPDCTHGDQIEFLRRVSNTTYDYAEVISEAFNNSDDSESYTDSNLDKQLRLVSRLIKGGLGSKIYMVSLGGFDTHGNQPETHQSLLTQLSESIKIFYNDLNYDGFDSKVLTMTFSEFGRRVRENGSEGTDHGSSAPVMLFGPALRGSGFVGEHPSLSALDKRGNMQYGVDFRSIYQTILTNWLCGDSNYINNAMLGEDFDLLGLGFACDDKDIVDYDSLVNYHYPIYLNGNKKVDLNLRLKQDHNISINVFDILGRHVSNVYDGMLKRGEHNFGLSENQFKKLSNGQYFYSIKVSGGNTLSKSFIVK